MNNNFSEEFKHLDNNGLQEDIDVASATIVMTDLNEEKLKVDKNWEALKDHIIQKEAAVFHIDAENAVQTKLLESQLREMEEQNKSLRKNNTILNDLNTKLKEEAESSRIEAKKSRTLAKWALIVSIALTVISIVVSILIA